MTEEQIYSIAQRHIEKCSEGVNCALVEDVCAAIKEALLAASAGQREQPIADRIKAKLPSIRAKTGNALFDAGVHDACEKIESLLAEIERIDHDAAKGEK